MQTFVDSFFTYILIFMPEYITVYVLMIHLLLLNSNIVALFLPRNDFFPSAHLILLCHTMPSPFAFSHSISFTFLLRNPYNGCSNVLWLVSYLLILFSYSTSVPFMVFINTIIYNWVLIFKVTLSIFLHKTPLGVCKYWEGSLGLYFFRS